MLIDRKGRIKRFDDSPEVKAARDVVEYALDHGYGIEALISRYSAGELSGKEFLAELTTKLDDAHHDMGAEPPAESEEYA